MLRLLNTTNSTKFNSTWLLVRTLVHTCCSRHILGEFPVPRGSPDHFMDQGPTLYCLLVTFIALASGLHITPLTLILLLPADQVRKACRFGIGLLLKCCRRLNSCFCLLALAILILIPKSYQTDQLYIGMAKLRILGLKCSVIQNGKWTPLVT